MITNFNTYLLEKSGKKITDILILTRDERMKEYNCSVWDINNGYCVEFTDDVINRMGGYNDNLYELSSDMFFSMFPKDVEYLWKDVIKTSTGIWSVKMLDLYGYPPIDLNHFTFGNHSWIFFDGKHYDAECVGGVSKWYELPLFQKEIK